jgi:hypothetical protein
VGALSARQVLPLPTLQAAACYRGKGPLTEENWKSEPMNTNKQNEVSFAATQEEFATVCRIVNRCRAMGQEFGSAMDMQMDLLATHANGCPMDFKRLEQADDFNLLHDISGIYRHLNRETGQLENFFRPRFAAKS